MWVGLSHLIKRKKLPTRSKMQFLCTHLTHGMKYQCPVSCYFYKVTFQTEAHPTGIYLFKVSNRNTRTRFEICSKLTIKTPELRQWRCSGVSIVNFGHTLHLVLVFLLLTIVNFEHVIVRWDALVSSPIQVVKTLRKYFT